MSNVAKHERNQESDKQSEKGLPFSKLRAPELCVCAQVVHARWEAYICE